MWLPAVCLWPLAWRLKRRGFSVRLFSYPSVRADLQTNAGRLTQFLSGIDAATVHLVGHSLGGTLIRTLFHYYPHQKPGRIVTLGTPHGGSCVARHLNRYAWRRRVMGRSVAQLLAGVTRGWALPPREIGVVSGTRALGMGRLLYRRLPPPNDGLLTLAESALPGARDRLVLAVSHTGMLFSPVLAHQVGEFLDRGRFTR